MAKPICSIADCARSTIARGWCSMHYSRWKRTGATGPKACQVCGTPVPPRRSATCSAECQAEASRRRARAWYAEHGQDPGHVERVRVTTKRHYEKAVADPELKAVRLARTAAWRAANPEKVRETQRAYWRANAARKREKDHRRRARLLDAFVEDVSIDVLWERDAGICGVCSEPVDPALPWPGRMVATIDHVIPLARGGEHSYANTQLAHMGCNARKGDRLPK